LYIRSFAVAQDDKPVLYLCTMSVLAATENHVIPSYPLVTLDGGKPAMIEVHEANGIDVIIEDAFLLPHRKDYYFFAFIERGRQPPLDRFFTHTLLSPGISILPFPNRVHLKEESTPVKGYIAGFTEEFLSLEENRMLRRLPVIQNPAGAHEIGVE
jgi:AraC family transcriptional activator of pobA